MNTKIIAIAIVAVIVLAYLFVSGVIKLPTISIKSSEQAKNTAVNISSNIEGVSSTLESIDKKLG